VKTAALRFAYDAPNINLKKSMAPLLLV